MISLAQVQQETNIYTEAQASIYEPSLVPDETMSSYGITPIALGLKMPGQMFDIALLAGDDPISPTATQKTSLSTMLREKQ